MYAIVDIETTGGTLTSGRITEIAILIHDGKKIIKQFHTLVNPCCRIPYHITRLTEITNEMILDAPAFYEIAKEIVELTKDMVFVAHNVTFDYGFVKAAFRDLGYDYQRKTLCTVQLAKTTFPGLPSYSLGKLCETMDIEIENRHRALGDAQATALLFSKIMETNPGCSPAAIAHQEEIKKAVLPPLLNAAVFEKIPPSVTGVYYFYNLNGEVIYVGKSRDIKKRLMQHFSSKGRKKAIRMLHEITDISYENTGSELVALLLESDEIKTIRPKYNVSQKRTSGISYFGIFREYDKKGYLNLFSKRIRRGEEPLITTETSADATELLYRLSDKHNLCLSKCGLHKMSGACFDYHTKKCRGACVEKEMPAVYNVRVKKAIKSFSFENESFLIAGDGRNKTEKSIVCIEQGKYLGFGYIDFSFGSPGIGEMRDCIKHYNHNKNIQQILHSFMKHEHIKIPFASGQLELYEDPVYEL